MNDTIDTLSRKQWEAGQIVKHLTNAYRVPYDLPTVCILCLAYSSGAIMRKDYVSTFMSASTFNRRLSALTNDKLLIATYVGKTSRGKQYAYSLSDEVKQLIERALLK